MVYVHIRFVTGFFLLSWCCEKFQCYIHVFCQLFYSVHLLNLCSLVYFLLSLRLLWGWLTSPHGIGCVLLSFHLVTAMIYVMLNLRCGYGIIQQIMGRWLKTKINITLKAFVPPPALFQKLRCCFYTRLFADFLQCMCILLGYSDVVTGRSVVFFVDQRNHWLSTDCSSVCWTHTSH